jgi:hypothetical protein
MALRSATRFTEMLDTLLFDGQSLTVEGGARTKKKRKRHLKNRKEKNVVLGVKKVIS